MCEAIVGRERAPPFFEESGSPERRTAEAAFTSSFSPDFGAAQCVKAIVHDSLQRLWYDRYG